MVGRVQGAATTVKAQGSLGMVMYTFGLAVATVCMVPATPIEVMAGYIFGFWNGTCMCASMHCTFQMPPRQPADDAAADHTLLLCSAILGKLVGSMFSFFLARTVLRAWVVSSQHSRSPLSHSPLSAIQ
eukprot:SAG11_NODE_5170_length_1641_cov_1.225681_2_plen_129_part_00